MDAILNEMRQFSVRISQDHDFHCHATDPILGDTAAGHVLIDTAVDDIADEAQAYDDLSLFFGDDDVDPLDVDTENIDRGAVGEEQTTEDALGTSQVADEGLNNLADQIVSQFSTIWMLSIAFLPCYLRIDRKALMQSPAPASQLFAPILRSNPMHTRTMHSRRSRLLETAL